MDPKLLAIVWRYYHTAILRPVYTEKNLLIHTFNCN
jgi:hypothetical protein